mmetsp:Transcript_17968/g.38447  ORF Transcript_17968/g.38447 Transcript_17968/m.38447 type:complete len:124 (-) Transcript_17968:25-396(-)
MLLPSPNVTWHHAGFHAARSGRKKNKKAIRRLLAAQLRDQPGHRNYCMHVPGRWQCCRDGRRIRSSVYAQDYVGGPSCICTRQQAKSADKASLQPSANRRTSRMRTRVTCCKRRMLPAEQTTG